MKDIQKQGDQLILTNHINSIRKVDSSKKVYYKLGLIPTLTQVTALRSIGEKKQIQEDLLRDRYYCKEQNIANFLGCFKYELISINQTHDYIQLINERLLKTSTLVFFVSIFPLDYTIIGLSFFQFMLILISRFFIQNQLQPKKTLGKTKMRVLMILWILVSLLLICVIAALIIEQSQRQDKNTFYRMVSIMPFQIFLLFYQIYQINYLEQYLFDIVTLYSQEEINELHKSKLIIDFYLLQKHFQCHLNSSQKFYLLKKNPQCNISEESIKFAIENVNICEKFYQENLIVTKKKKDLENQSSEQGSYSEKILNKVIANAILYEIKDQLASSEALNQQELASIIETNKQKKQQDNLTMLPPLLSRRSSLVSNIPQTPSCYSPSYQTNRNFLQIDNNQYLNLNTPSDIQIKVPSIVQQTQDTPQQPSQQKQI